MNLLEENSIRHDTVNSRLCLRTGSDGPPITWFTSPEGKSKRSECVTYYHVITTFERKLHKNIKKKYFTFNNISIYVFLKTSQTDKRNVKKDYIRCMIVVNHYHFTLLQNRTIVNRGEICVYLWYFFFHMWPFKWLCLFTVEALIFRSKGEYKFFLKWADYYF